MSHLLELFVSNPQAVGFIAAGVFGLLLLQAGVRRCIRRLPAGNLFYRIPAEALEDKGDARMVQEFEAWLRKARNCDC